MVREPYKHAIFFPDDGIEVSLDSCSADCVPIVLEKLAAATEAAVEDKVK